jgi:dUTP pyrophosphatase
VFTEYAMLRDNAKVLRSLRENAMCQADGLDIEVYEREHSKLNAQFERAACLYARGITHGNEEPTMLEVKVLQGELVKGTPNSAGYDLSAVKDVTIPVGGHALIPVGLITQMSAGMFAMIRDRSGQAWKNRLTTRAGIIDADYPKEWCVVLVNESDKVAEIKQGDRIAQAIFMSYLDVGGVILEPERKGGFGSTGVG